MLTREEIEKRLGPVRDAARRLAGDYTLGDALALPNAHDRYIRGWACAALAALDGDLLHAAWAVRNVLAPLASLGTERDKAVSQIEVVLSATIWHGLQAEGRDLMPIIRAHPRDDVIIKKVAANRGVLIGPLWRVWRFGGAVDCNNTVQCEADGCTACFDVDADHPLWPDGPFLCHEHE